MPIDCRDEYSDYSQIERCVILPNADALYMLDYGKQGDSPIRLAKVDMAARFGDAINQEPVLLLSGSHIGNPWSIYAPLSLTNTSEDFAVVVNDAGNLEYFNDDLDTVFDKAQSQVASSGFSREMSQSTSTPSALPDTSDTAGELTDREVTEFVQRYLNLNELNDITSAMDLYTGYIDYFDRGNLARSEVRSDKAAYYQRWPTREYTLASGVETISANGSERRVRFDYDYRVQNGSKEASGKAYTFLDLFKQGGQIMITGEDGGTYDQPEASTPNPDAAPKFTDWSFQQCTHPDTGQVRYDLPTGWSWLCEVTVDTIPNGATLTAAEFSFELEYPSGGSTAIWPMENKDYWPYRGSGARVQFQQYGDTLSFTIPLHVKERPERQYNVINVMGKLSFSNGSSKQFFQPIPVTH